MKNKRLSCFFILLIGFFTFLSQPLEASANSVTNEDNEMSSEVINYTPIYCSTTLSINWGEKAPASAFCSASSNGYYYSGYVPYVRSYAYADYIILYYEGLIYTGGQTTKFIE